MRFVIFEVNAPVPVLLLVLVDKATVGFWLVDQITPRAVTVAPPSSDIFPPLFAVVWVIPLAAVVVTEGIEIAVLVLNDTSFP